MLLVLALTAGIARLDAATITNSILDGSDDAYSINVETQSITADYLRCGYYTNDAPYYISAFRFQYVGITQGTVIVSAHLRLQAYFDGTGSSELLIKGEAYDTPNPYNLTPYIEQRDTTTNQAVWNIPTAWSEDEVVTSPDIKDIIQEIIDRPGWRKDNPLALQLRNNISSGGYQKIYSFEGAPKWEGASAAQLIIEIEGELPPDETKTVNYIPGATNNPPTHVPLYLNDNDMYYPPASGGLCWASAAGSIIGYWDRTPYNGTNYWNLIDHGTAPLRQPELPTEAGHDQADVKSVIAHLAHQYYGENRTSEEAAILDEYINQTNGLDFSIQYHSAISGLADRTNYYAIIRGEIDAGRPVSIGSYDTYFGGAHQVPVYGYRETSNIVNSTVYVHRNTGGTQREYASIFASNWGNMDMNTFVPGGTPADHYEALGDNDSGSAVTINPDDIYNFRQTHNFSVTNDQDWISLQALSNRLYTIQTGNPGTNCHTLLTLFSSDGTTWLAQNDNGGEEEGASEINWYCHTNLNVFIRATEKFGRHGPAANYDLQVSYAIDTDGDEVPDWMEEIAGTDTNDSGDVFLIETFSIPQETGTAVLCWNSVTDRTYTVYMSTNLTKGGWSNVYQRAGNNNRLCYTSSPALPEKSFLRLGVRHNP